MGTITTTDGTEIFYKDWGPKDAQPIVFHHGWPLSADDWDAQMMFFLSQGFRVIAHDRRGHGRSTQTDDRQRDGHLRRRRRRAGRGARPQERHPCRPFDRRRRGRPLCRRAKPGPRRQGRADRRRAAGHGQDGDESRRDCRSRCSTAFARRSRPTARSSTSISPAGPFYGFNRPGAKVSQGVIQNWWRQGMMGGAKAHYDCIKAFSETDFTEDLKAIDVPVLVMHGEDDQIVPDRGFGAAVGQAAEERHAEDLSAASARHGDDACGGDQQGHPRLHPRRGLRSRPGGRADSDRRANPRSR